MVRRMRPIATVVAVIAAVVTTSLAAAAPASAHPKPGRGTPVTVMTRNLYLGADINRPIAAVQGLSGVPALLAFAHANHDVRTIVAQTDFPARAVLLAGEIARRGPDLIGLQEVALWRHGPLELGAIGVPDATVVDYDFLGILLHDLARLGRHYQVVSNQQESDVEGPAFEGSPFDGTLSSDAADVRLTMRDVILKRSTSRVHVIQSGSGQYATRITLNVAGVPFSFIRGFNWADVRLGAKSFRFVNTHLESASSDVALAQANELLHGAAAVTNRPVIIVCDCNSDPLNNTVKPTDTVPHSAPYNLITGPGGFTDEWLQWAPASAGFTSGLSEFVNDPDLSKIDHRIDMVFARPGMPVKHGWITGRDARTPNGLWASDHMGVVIKLRP